MGMAVDIVVVVHVLIASNSRRKACNARTPSCSLQKLCVNTKVKRTNSTRGRCHTQASNTSPHSQPASSHRLRSTKQALSLSATIKSPSLSPQSWKARKESVPTMYKTLQLFAQPLAFLFYTASYLDSAYYLQIPQLLVR